jgi:arabinan endo-1,5-alpha-L-arabinosidase
MRLTRRAPVAPRPLLLLGAAVCVLCFAGPQPLAAAPAYAHDPVIAREGSFYYLFSTGQGIPVSRSRDLLTWDFLPPVFLKRPAWLREEMPESAADFWAPDVSFHDGSWYLYYAASTFGRNRSRIALATNPTLDPSRADFTWTDRGSVIGSDTGDDWNAIDPALTVDEQGKWHLTFGSFWTGIKQVELDPSTGKPSTPRPPMVSLAQRPGVPNDPIEAPFISRHANFWYLWVSFDYCCRALQSDYKIAVGRSRAITGPYTDREGRDMREGGGTVVVQGEGDIHGPGHCAVLRDGDRELLVHHAYDGKRHGAAVLQLRPISWEDDWPIIGPPLGK